MNINYMQNGIGGGAAANFQNVSSIRMSGIPGETDQISESLNLLNRREHM